MSRVLLLVRKDSLTPRLVWVTLSVSWVLRRAPTRTPMQHVKVQPSASKRRCHPWRKKVGRAGVSGAVSELVLAVERKR